MRKNVIRLALCAMLFALCPSAEAQQAKKVARIGYLGASSSSTNPARIEAFRQGLRELGYVEGKNIVVEWRYAEGKLHRLRELAAELVRLKVDVIVTGGSQATGPTKETTSTIPIVMAQDNDPLGQGFIASLARPGGNITGLSTHYPEISGKQLEILKEIVPRLPRVAVLKNSTVPGIAETLRETEGAAATTGVQLQYLEVQGPEDIETAFRAASKGRADAVLLLPNSRLNENRKALLAVAGKSRPPVMYRTAEFVEHGGLMTYSVSIDDLFRRAAYYVDRIVKGANPAELPVEQPTKFELVINLKTAKQIGLTIPPNVLARADRVIK